MQACRARRNHDRIDIHEATCVAQLLPHWNQTHGCDGHINRYVAIYNRLLSLNLVTEEELQTIPGFNEFSEAKRAFAALLGSCKTLLELDQVCEVFQKIYLVQRPLIQYLDYVLNRIAGLSGAPPYGFVPCSNLLRSKYGLQPLDSSRRL